MKKFVNAIHELDDLLADLLDPFWSIIKFIIAVAIIIRLVNWSVM